MSMQATAEGQLLGVLIAVYQPTAVRETVAFLIFGDSENWRVTRQSTRRPKGPIARLLYAVWLLLNGFPQLVPALLREPGRRARQAEAKPATHRSAHLLAFGVDLEQRELMQAALRDAVAEPA